jgi:hypothetical protein
VLRNHQQVEGVQLRLERQDDEFREASLACHTCCARFEENSEVLNCILSCRSVHQGCLLRKVGSVGDLVLTAERVAYEACYRGQQPQLGAVMAGRFLAPLVEGETLASVTRGALSQLFVFPLHTGLMSTLMKTWLLGARRAAVGLHRRRALFPGRSVRPRGTLCPLTSSMTPLLVVKGGLVLSLSRLLPSLTTALILRLPSLVLDQKGLQRSRRQGWMPHWGEPWLLQVHLVLGLQG